MMSSILGTIGRICSTVSHKHKHIHHAHIYRDLYSLQVLFVGLYPHGVVSTWYLSKRVLPQSQLYNGSVYQSRHPLVCKWIEKAVCKELHFGNASRIGIVLYSPCDGKAYIMERYMLDLSAWNRERETS